MGYDLRANNKECEDFHFGAFSFPVLLDACGYLFICIHKGSRWFFISGIDERMPIGDKYPRLLSNDGMEITAEEAKIMARIAKNFVIIQNNLDDDSEWPIKIRKDFVDKFEAFSKWAPKTDGFKIY